jgi:Flp pilus assembly protein TadB
MNGELNSALLIDWLLKLVIVASVGMVGYTIAQWLLSLIRSQSQAGALADYYATLEASEKVVEKGQDKAETLSKVRLTFLRLGIDVSGKEEVALYAAYGITGLVVFLLLSFFHLGSLIALSGAVVMGVAIPKGLINRQWQKIQLEIESEIPTFMRNLAGILKAEGNLVDALQSAASALDPQKTLATWVNLLAHRIQRQGDAAFEEMIPEADEISSALSLVIFEIMRMRQTGGGGYARAFENTANNLAETLAIKAQANAKAEGGSNMALAIIGAAVISLVYIISSPVGADVFLPNPLFKVGLVVSIAWGAFGWNYIQELIKEAIA